MNFLNKNIIITGGTGGIGTATVQAFHDTGANILLTGTKNTIDKNFDYLINQKNIDYCQLDLSSEDSLESFTQVLKEIGNIDVLINNAGVNKIDKINKVTSEDWDWINKVNLKGPFTLMRLISEKMKKKKSGKIINISSIFSVVSKVKRSVYSASKWGLVGLTKAVALELAPFNIQVNAVSPGFVDTKLTRRIIGEKNLIQLEKSIPQGRLANPKEIASVILFLSSENNTYLTGQNIIVDGGYTSA